MKYLETKDNKVLYNGVDLAAFAEKHGTPTKIVFLDIVENQIKFLKNTFDNAIKKAKYNGKFCYLNANKANYASEIVYTAFKYSDATETSSHYDLELSYELFKTFKNEAKDKFLVCNGFKTLEYTQKIYDIHTAGTKIIDVIDDLNELDYLLSKEYKYPMEVGLRINIEGLYGHKAERDRFGLSEKDLKVAVSKLKNQSKLKLTTVHFHQRGFEYEDDKFYVNINKIANYYASLKEDFASIQNLDIGGGTPWFYDDKFNYQKWANNLILNLKKFFDDKGISHPNLFIENGKYTTKDSIVNLYSVAGVKNTDPNFLWYILDTSLLMAIPEYYMCGEPMKFLALNNLESKKVKTKLCGITCDCDDIYFDQEKGYILMPKITDKKQYIGIIGTGSYQDSLTANAQIRHCLIPNEQKFVSFIKNGNRKFELVKNTKSPKEVFKDVDFDKKYLKSFK